MDEPIFDPVTYALLKQQVTEETNKLKETIIPYVQLTDMTANTTEALIASLNANFASLPKGAIILRMGNSVVSTRCVVIMAKINDNIARAITISVYNTIHQLSLNAASGEWSVDT